MGIAVGLTFVLAVGFALTLGAGAAHAATFVVNTTRPSRDMRSPEWVG